MQFESYPTLSANLLSLQIPSHIHNAERDTFELTNS